jgi:PAS domain S-box-containing protein
MEFRQRITTENNFIVLLESAPDAMVITDETGCIQLVNAQVEQMFGYHRNELMGEKVEMLLPERFHHRHIGHRSNYALNPRVRPMGEDMELFGRRKDGKEFPVAISLSPLDLKDEGGIVIIAAIRDISKQKEAEESIKLMNESLEVLVEKRTKELEDSLLKVKSAQTEIDLNQQRLALLIKASEVINSSLDYNETLKNISKLVVPELADWCAIDIYSSDGKLLRLIAVHENPKKSVLISDLCKFSKDSIFSPHPLDAPRLYTNITETDFNPTLDNEGLKLFEELSPHSSIMSPIKNRDNLYGNLIMVRTESRKPFDQQEFEYSRELIRKSALAIENSLLFQKSRKINFDLEKRVIIRTQELETMNKELEAFSYSVSHDLRAPLRSIDGFTSRILTDYGNQLDETGNGLLNRVRNASQKMGHLIDDLLKLSRLSRMEISLEKINLSSIAEAIIADLVSSEPERVTEIEIQKDIEATADLHLMQIALQNLLDNAWKYTRKQNVTRIQFKTQIENGHPVYTLIDNGVGFDMRYVNKLFGAFQRLHGSNEFEGNGIGLATVQRIIHRHHGHIWTESEVDKGASFFFTLPKN